jgi:hypothetical protein
MPFPEHRVLEHNRNQDNGERAAAKQRKPRDLTRAERDRFELEVPVKP